MTQDEACGLLDIELDRLGYEPKTDDDDQKKAILEAAGRVPLAIKWAAQMAAERRSLKEASSILRGTGPGKQAFLSFCFATMYDALSDIAKDAAKLIPYLDSEWQPMTLAIMLDQPIDAVRLAIFELADQGLIFSNEEDDEDYDVLPLTKEFLSKKWNEDQSFRKKAMARLDEMFEADGADHVLRNWPEERRVRHLIPIARDRTRSAQRSSALKIINLAQSWISTQDMAREEVVLRFLEGQNLYMIGRVAPGIAHMRQALSSEETSEILDGTDLLFFAEALFSFGGYSAEKEACTAVGIAMQRKTVPRPSVWLSFLTL